MPAEIISNHRVILIDFGTQTELAEGLVSLAELTAGISSKPYEDAVGFRNRVLSTGGVDGWYLRMRSVFFEGDQYGLNGLFYVGQVPEKEMMILMAEHTGAIPGSQPIVQTAEFLEALIIQKRKNFIQIPSAENQGSHLGNP